MITAIIRNIENITPATAVTSGLRMQPVHPKLPTRQA